MVVVPVVVVVGACRCTTRGKAFAATLWWWQGATRLLHMSPQGLFYSTMLAEPVFLCLVTHLAVDASLVLPRDDIDMANAGEIWATQEGPNHLSLHSPSAFNLRAGLSPAHYSVRNSAGTITVADVAGRWRGGVLTVDVAAAVFNTSVSTTLVVASNTVSRNLRVNQVGYLSSGPKRGYLGQWFGNNASGHAVHLSLGPSFPFQYLKALAHWLLHQEGRLVVQDDGSPAFSGKASVQAEADPLSNMTVYKLDFSAFQPAVSGMYSLQVAGVGLSYPFRVSPSAYRPVLGNVMSGLYHARCGTALTSNLTRWTRDIDHEDDGVVVATDPPPAWFSPGIFKPSPLLCPCMWWSALLTVPAPHLTQGNYSWYHSDVAGARFASRLIIAFDVFPDRLGYDDLGIPESGNGIPDLLDEAKWELDWLEGMQDPTDGGAFCIVKPNLTYYQSGMPSAPKNQHRVLYPKDTGCTLRLAAALATAAASTAMQRYFPSDVVRWKAGAVKAYGWAQQHPVPLCYHFYGCEDKNDPLNGTDKVLDSRVWAAVSMYFLTGDQQAHQYFLTHHYPHFRQWGWQFLPEGWGMINLYYTFYPSNNYPKDQTMLNATKSELIAAGDALLGWSQDRAFGLALADSPIRYRALGWYFPQENALNLVFASLLNKSGADAYLSAAVAQWDYLLGANPAAWSYFTGIGWNRLRTAVDNDSEADGIEDPVPGIPKGITWGTYYTNTYGKLPGSLFPTWPDYPLGQLMYDGFSVDAAAFFSEPVPVSPLKVQIKSNTTLGTAPMPVRFELSTTNDTNVMQPRWDFNNPLSFNSAMSMVAEHTFSAPFAVHNVTCVVTTADGQLAWDWMVVSTQPRPAEWPFPSAPYATDSSTLGLWHFDAGWTNASGAQPWNSQHASLSSDNLLWMLDPHGKAVRLGGIDSSVNVSVNASAMGPALTLEAKLYVEAWGDQGFDNFVGFGISDSWNANMELVIGKWDPPMVQITGPKSKALLVNSSLLATHVTLPSSGLPSTWLSLALCANATSSAVYINGVLSGFADVGNPFVGKKTLDITIGSFTGYVDEVRLSSSW
eukprot:gene3611-673_t